MKSILLGPAPSHSVESEFSLKSIRGRFGHSIPFWDDGFGPLWIHRDSMGIDGVVRAQSWEDAYSCWEDELAPDCDLSEEELVAEYGERRESVRIIRDKKTGEERESVSSDFPLEPGQFVRWETRVTPDPTFEAVMDNPCFQESYGFRSSGNPSNPGLSNLIYSKDINGDSLERLTPELAKELGLSIAWEVY